MILDGKIAATHFLNQIKNIQSSIPPTPYKPHLSVLLVGNDPRSAAYVKAKKRMAEELGFGFTLITLPLDVSEPKILGEIARLNQDKNISGIIVQLPVPQHIDPNKLINAISPEKDVDGFTPENMGRLIVGGQYFVPATPLGVLMMMKYYHIKTSGKRIVIVGRSNIVGRPLSILLSQNHSLGNATVTLCHQHTKDLEYITKQADMIILAIGKAHFLKAEMISEGVSIIDVGINVILDDSSKERLVGDADFDSVKNIASSITPVPGGVGRMTIAGLMFNTFKAFCNQHRLSINLDDIFDLL